MERTICSSRDSTLPGAGAQLHALLVELGRMRPLRDLFGDVGGQFEMTPSQVHTLMWLGHNGAMTMGSLARSLGITEKTVTGVVDRLERDGFLERERDGSDRRVVNVKLTRKGSGISARMRRAVDEQIDFILSLLDPEDRDAVVRVFTRLVNKLQAAQAAQGNDKEANR